MILAASNFGEGFPAELAAFCKDALPVADELCARFDDATADRRALIVVDLAFRKEIAGTARVPWCASAKGAAFGLLLVREEAFWVVQRFFDHPDWSALVEDILARMRRAPACYAPILWFVPGQVGVTYARSVHLSKGGGA